MSNHQDKTKIKNHVEWPNAAATGTSTTPLVEPVPGYLLRKGDMILRPKNDNNTAIIFGRDRNPYGPPRSLVPHGSEEDPNNPESKFSEVSGFSDHMGAGAIDIVVGRGAPFPLESKKHDMFPENLPPLYCTRTPDKLTTAQLTGGPHPGYIMDAARIYISQMCQIDDYFELKRPKLGNPIKDFKGPCSAIMLKADKLRLHSRRDVYIVAGGDQRTTHDSNNNAISDSGRIHLVAGNQTDPNVRDTTFAVRYKELSLCLKDIMSSIQGATEILNSFLMYQKALNYMLAHAIYGTATGMTTGNPSCQALESIVDPALMTELLNVDALKRYNIPKIELNYLTVSGTRSIASRHVTLN